MNFSQDVIALCYYVMQYLYIEILRTGNELNLQNRRENGTRLLLNVPRYFTKSELFISAKLILVFILMLHTLVQLIKILFYCRYLQKSYNANIALSFRYIRS